jgi:hypothetical protein
VAGGGGYPRVALSREDWRLSNSPQHSHMYDTSMLLKTNIWVLCTYGHISAVRSKKKLGACIYVQNSAKAEQ